MTKRIRNPFTPTFGKVPPYLAGRDEILHSMDTAFENGSGDPNLSTILVGARGTGKTALLSSIANAALEAGWISANVSAAPGMLEDIIQRTKEAASSFIRSSRKAEVTGLSLGGVCAINVERPAMEAQNWRSRMNAIFEQLEEYDIGLLITVDEVVANLDEMLALASTYQHFIREDRKVALVMAGLPHNVSMTLANDSVSFLRRCRQWHLGRLRESDVENALLNTVALGGRNITDDALDYATQAADGFPYMLQLVGYYIWAASTRQTIVREDAVRGVRQARQEFRIGVLDQTYRELSKGDVRFLQAMLPDKNVSSLHDIATRMGVKTNYASQYKSRLLAAGVIAERGKSLVGFDMPGMREYLQAVLQ